MTAEYALKARLGAGTSYIVSSAGIEARAQSMHEWVLARLHEKGADPSHVQRQLTEELVEAADFVIAMGRNHQAFIRKEYGHDVPLFNHISARLPPQTEAIEDEPFDSVISETMRSE